MSTSVTLSATQQAFLEHHQEPIIEEPLADPVNIAIAAAGHAKRARRREDCRKFGWFERCARGHVTIHVNDCGCRTCQKSAERLRDTLIEEWESTTVHLSRDSRYPSFAYLELHISTAFTQWDVREAVERVIAKMNKLTFGSETLRGRATFFRLVWVAGVNDDRQLVIRVLTTIDSLFSLSALQEEFRYAKIDTRVLPISHLSPSLLNYLFAICIPESDDLKVQMELSFIRLRRLRTVGASSSTDPEDDPAELSVDESTLTDNSADPKYSSCSKCHCGAEIIERSNRTLVHFSPIALRYYQKQPKTA